MNHTTEHHSASGARQAAAMASPIARELNRYDAHLRDVRGLAAGTRKHCIRIVGRLLHQKFAKRPIEFSKLRPDDVRQFLADQLDRCQTPSHASQLASALRSYLRYRTTCGDPTGALLAVIQKPVHWSLATLPLTETEHAIEEDDGQQRDADTAPVLGLRGACHCCFRLARLTRPEAR